MQKYKLEALNLLYMYYYFIIIDKSNILHVAGKLEQAEHKSRIFNMFDWIQCGRPSASHPQDAVYQNHANSQAQSDDATFAVCAFVLRYQPRMCARQSATAADTNTFYRARLLPRLVLCTAAYRKKMMHIKGVPRWQAPTNACGSPTPRLRVPVTCASAFDRFRTSAAPCVCFDGSRTRTAAVHPLVVTSS